VGGGGSGEGGKEEGGGQKDSERRERSRTTIKRGRCTKEKYPERSKPTK
jgi:hypothetical protein